MTWKTKKLDEVCNVDYGTRVVKTRNIPGDFYVYGGGGRTFTSNEYNRENCVIVSRFAMSANCVRKISRKFFLNDSGLSVSIKDENILSQDFLDQFLFAQQEKIYSLGRGQAQRNLYIDGFKEIEIPLPPLSEQKRIVKILDEKMKKIHEAKLLREESIKDTEKILSRTLHEIFEGGKKKGWGEKDLGEMVKIIGGGTPSKSESSFYGGDIPWASVRDMRNDYLSNTELLITKDAVKNSSTNIIPKNEIVIATRVGLGKVCVLQQDTAINQDLKAIIPLNENLNRKYLFWWIKSKEKEIIKNGRGATVMGVRLEFIRALQIPIISLTEQKQIVKKLDTLSEKLRTLRDLQTSQLDDLKKLEKAYLREAFDGEL